MDPTTRRRWNFLAVLAIMVAAAVAAALLLIPLARR